MYGNVIRRLLSDLAWVDDLSYYHSLRVGYLMSRFGEVDAGKQFIKQAWVTRNEFVAAGFLHDIAKVRWPREILLTGESFKNSEREALLRVWGYIIDHPLGSEEILMDYYEKTGNRFWERIAKGVAYHHENYSGDGYPYRLKGAEIPLLARGLRIFDHYVESIEVRRHKNKPQNPGAVIKEMRSALGVYFDPYWGEKVLDYIETLPTLPANLDEWFNEELKKSFNPDQFSDRNPAPKPN